MGEKNTNIEKYYYSKGNKSQIVMLERKHELEKLIREKKKALSNAPDGYLRVLDRKTYAEYYWRKNSSDINGEFIPKKDWNIARGLAQRDYDVKILNLAEKELKIVDKYLGIISSNDISSVYGKLSDKRRMLVVPYRTTDEAFIKKWLEQDYEPMGFEKGAAEYYSDNGLRVRSKSEILIANALDKYCIPFRYEYPLMLKKSGVVRPDFTCLNIRTRKEYIWEHFGMMDDEGYAHKNVLKINDYETSGFHAGINMILTFETSLTPINSNIIRAMIENYLI